MLQHELSTSQLIRDIRAKSRMGAEALYDQYSRVFSLAIFRIVGNRDLTEVILVKTIQYIWDNAALYDEQQGPLLAWMMGIARNLATQQMIFIEPVVTDPKIVEFRIN